MTGWLAKILSTLGQVENIVDNLERHAKVRSVLPERRDMVFWRLPNDGAHFRRARKQRCGLSIDSPLVLFSCLIDPMGVEHLAELSIANVAQS